MTTSTERTVRLVVLLHSAFVPAASSGCGAPGIRELVEHEAVRLDALAAEVARGGRRFARVLREIGAAEEAALRESARFDARIESARVVHGLARMLVAGEGPKSAGLDRTRAKVLLYHLAEAGSARAASLEATLESASERRNALGRTWRALARALRAAALTQRALHEALDGARPERLLGALGEGERELGELRRTLEDAGTDGRPVLERIARASAHAERRLERARERLERLLEVWQDLETEDDA